MTNPFGVDKTVEKWLLQAQQEGKLDFEPSKRCRVCKDPVIRSLVNKMIARAFSDPDIVDVLEAHNLHLMRDGKPKITKDCIQNHRTRHFDVQSPAGALLRKIQEESALKYGQDFTEGMGTMLNAYSYYQTMMVKGYESLINPAYLVDPVEGAKAATKLHEMQRTDAGDYDRARMLADVGRIVDAARTFVTEDQWPAFQAMLRGERLTTDRTAVEAVRMIDIDDTPDTEE
jgi:hypothetical protein